VVDSDRLWHEFADRIAQSYTLRGVEEALVRAVSEATGGCRVELLRESTPLAASSGPKLLASWSAESEGAQVQEPEAEGPSLRSRPVRLTVRCGDHHFGILQIFRTRNVPSLSPRLIRRLQTLCTVAAAAGRGMRPVRSVEEPVAFWGSPALDLGTVQDSHFLNAFLPYAMAQAQRHHEPLSLLCVGIDRWAVIRGLLGPEVASQAIRHTAETIVGTLRASDVVARLDDGRIVAVLANAGPAESAHVAEIVREAVALEGAGSDSMPPLTISIGVATYPHDAVEPGSLIAAAAAALSAARSEGRNRVATAQVAPASATTRTIAQCAG
jgi:diguanylate cyclase (GGDEF)-like protein